MFLVYWTTKLLLAEQVMEILLQYYWSYYYSKIAMEVCHDVSHFISQCEILELIYKFLHHK